MKLPKLGMMVFLLGAFLFPKSPTVSYDLVGNTNISAEYFKVSALVDLGLFRYREKIQQYAKTLSAYERSLMFDIKKMEPGASAFLNMAVGFGSGSFGQGDVPAGLICFFMDLGGIGTTIAGFANTSFDTRTTCLVIGVSVFLAGRILGAIFPGIFSEKFNTKLAHALELKF